MASKQATAFVAPGITTAMDSNQPQISSSKDMAYETMAFKRSIGLLMSTQDEDSGADPEGADLAAQLFKMAQAKVTSV